MERFKCIVISNAICKNEDVTLDVYSSNQIYGKEFAKKNDKDTGLFDQAKNLPNVNYIGYKPNEYILEHMTDYDLFVYPSIFEETFCASALEALASGLHVITTNFGALPETCAEWPVYVNYSKDHDLLASATAQAIDTASGYLHTDVIQNHLEEQQKFYKRFYSWEKKGMEWTNFLTGAIHAKQ